MLNKLFKNILSIVFVLIAGMSCNAMSKKERFFGKKRIHFKDLSLVSQPSLPYFEVGEQTGLCPCGCNYQRFNIYVTCDVAFMSRFLPPDTTPFDKALFNTIPSQVIVDFITNFFVEQIVHVTCLGESKLRICIKRSMDILANQLLESSLTDIDQKVELVLASTDHDDDYEKMVQEMVYAILISLKKLSPFEQNLMMKKH